MTKPTQICSFLGLIFNTNDLSVSVSDDKVKNCLNLIKELLSKESVKIRFLAKVIGTLISVCPAVRYGILYTKELERNKYLSLKYNNNNYEVYTKLNHECKEDLRWWIKNVVNPHNPIRKNHYHLEIFSDASKTGWGVSCGTETASGVWSDDESNLHINSLELMAAFFGLKCFTKSLNDAQILLRVDNVTAVSYINRLGGVQYPTYIVLPRESGNSVNQKIFGFLLLTLILKKT